MGALADELTDELLAPIGVAIDMSSSTRELRLVRYWPLGQRTGYRAVV